MAGVEAVEVVVRNGKINMEVALGLKIEKKSLTAGEVDKEGVVAVVEAS